MHKQKIKQTAFSSTIPDNVLTKQIRKNISAESLY